MSRKPDHPLRDLTDTERHALTVISRSRSEPAEHVTRAKVLLEASTGASFSEAARRVGRKSGDAVGHLVARFNDEGIAALAPRTSTGRPPTYSDEDRARILAEFERTPVREADGTATWSLVTLREALRRAPDGLPLVSTYTVLMVLHGAGYSWQRDRTWCPTGTAVRKRKARHGHRPRRGTQKKLIEDAYTLGEAMGLTVLCEDEAGPFQTVPYPGQSWQRQCEPARVPHEYVRSGTAKLLTLFHAASGQVRVQGTQSCTNAMLHRWIETQITEMLGPAEPASAAHRSAWLRWQHGLRLPFTLAAEVPPLRSLLVLDNLAGHKTPSLVRWLVAHGVMPLYTPLSGSWLNMAESIQRILIRRGLGGQHPQTPAEIMDALEATARGWNAHPTPFEWGGKRASRRRRSRERRHGLGGSGAVTRRAVRRVPSALGQWLRL